MCAEAFCSESFFRKGETHSHGREGLKKRIMMSYRNRERPMDGPRTYRFMRYCRPHPPRHFSPSIFLLPGIINGFKPYAVKKPQRRQLFDSIIVCGPLIHKIHLGEILTR